MFFLRPGAAVFLDRDGTLIRDVGYLRRVNEVEVLPKVPAALHLLREQGFKLVLVTNQSAVARGWLTEEDLGAIHVMLAAQWHATAHGLTPFTTARTILWRGRGFIGSLVVAGNPVSA